MIAVCGYFTRIYLYGSFLRYDYAVLSLMCTCNIVSLIAGGKAATRPRTRCSTVVGTRARSVAERGFAVATASQCCTGCYGNKFSKFTEHLCTYD